MTAEFAVLVPGVLLVLASCLAAVQVVGQQVRLTDAAADGARSLARGDDSGTAHARVQHSVGAASISDQRSGEYACIVVSQPAGFPPAALVGVTLSARSCALAGGL
ncbi:MAG TPA: TadE family type IV pilus minor pilin [Humibacter sp.]|nr:TadE family type IV pilus minor pilin [Humibacter sp.]